MKILLNSESINQIEFLLEKDYQKTVQNIDLLGLKCNQKQYYFWFEKAESDDTDNFIVLDLKDETIWKIDRIMNPIFFEKNILMDYDYFLAQIGQWNLTQEVRNYIEDNLIYDSFKKPYFIVDLYDNHIPDEIYYQLLEKNESIILYVKRREVLLPESLDFETVKYSINNHNLQLNTSDLYLMIPGKFEKNQNVWESIPDVSSTFFSCFKEKISGIIEAEYSTGFIDRIKRKCFGIVQLKIKDLLDGRIYTQDATVGIVKHDTGFCVLEIMIPNCNIGGNKVLNYYCGNQLFISVGQKEYTVDEYLKLLGIRKFGKRRSVAFAYSDIEEQELINALANEEFPMGKINGIFADEVRQGNIAIYDTAEVYVSNDTMIEKCLRLTNIIEYRLEYHAIEIFFVELIMLQDASIDKVYCDLNQEKEKQKNYQNAENAIERYEQLSFDMSQAMRFGNYEQFRFPSVRISAQNVAKKFGVDYIYDKYNLNKELLATMITANNRKLQEKQDILKNRFLLLLSALATIGTLGEIILNICSDSETGIFSYGTAIAVVLVGYFLYVIGNGIIKLGNRIYSKWKK